MAAPLSDKPVVSPVLVGRAQEIQTLEHALRTVRDGTGQCLFIASDAGVGKSRVLAEIRHHAVAQGFLTLQGHCFEQDHSFPYAPLIDALRAHLAQHTPPEIEQALGPLAPEIVKLIPELSLRLPELKPTPALDPEAERRRLFESLTLFFNRLAATRPLLITLEDLHWSDQISLDFLQLFTRRLPDYPILLLASYRHEESSLPLMHLLAHLERERLAREIRLVPLTRADVEAMLRAIFDLSRPVKAEFLDILYPLTEGNPFLIEEVLKSLITAGDIFLSEGQWERRPIEELHIPRSVQDAVQRRTEQLGEIEQEVLTLAAVAGQRFGYAVLREATGLPEPDLLQVIKQLIAAQLVVEESAEQFAFRHALTREAVYAMLLKRERQALHRRIADTLERVYAETLDLHEADLAYHYHAAEMWAKALEYSRRAGENAQALYAPREAIGHFTRALEAAQHLSRPLPTDLLRARGRAHERAGYFDAARSDYERVLDTARDAHDSSTEWQGLIDLGFLWASRDYSQTGGYFQQALELARGQDEPSRLAHSLNRLGNWYVNVEQPLEALQFHQEALAIFQRLGDQRGLAQTLDLLGMANYLGGDLIQGTADYEKAIVLFRTLDDRPALASSLATLTMRGGTYQTDAMVPAADLIDAARAGETALQIAREIGLRETEAYVRLTLAFCLGAQGEYGRALDLARSSLAIAEEIEHRQWTTAARCVLGVLYLDLLALSEARQHLEFALALAQEIGSWHWVRHAVSFLASTVIAQQDFAWAESVLDSTPGSESGAQTLGQRLYACARIELALAHRDPRLALSLIEQLLRSAANLSEDRVILRLWKLRGDALATLSQHREAEAVFLAAQADAFAQGARPWLWRIHIALGRLYQAMGRQHEAIQEFSAAREMMETLAANLPDKALRLNFVERAMSMMPRPPAPSPARAEKEKYGGLTAREREVAALIAQGKSNREIAAELVVGLRTVEAHITRILDKLGFSSRAQIAVWAVGKGLALPGSDDPG